MTKTQTPRERKGMFWNLNNRQAKGRAKKPGRLSLAGARLLQRRRGPRGQARDAVQTSKTVVEPGDEAAVEWQENPGLLDLRGVDDRGHGKSRKP